MSSPGETPELKAGHPPAVKVAGMRVVQNHKPHEKPVAEPVKAVAESGDVDEEEGLGTEVEKKPKEKLVVSGVATKGNADFPPEAIKAFHEKQVPSKQVVNHIPINHVAHVQQPRKNNS